MSRPLAVLLTTLLLPLAACGKSVVADDGRPTVVASFYPLEYLVHRIAGDQIHVLDLTAPGVEPHDLELHVKETAEIADADLVVYSAGLQPAVDQSVKQNARRSLDVSADVDIVGGNPHFWLDPVRMANAADAVEDELADLDPENATQYATNLASLRADLHDLDAAYRGGLAHCERDLVVTSHDAFGYQAKYGLEFAPIAGLNPESEPSPKHVAELRGLIEEHHVTTVFSETIASPKMADVLSHDLGLRTAVLDPIEGVEKGSGADYLSLMKANLVALEKANGCSGAASPDGKVSP